MCGSERAVCSRICLCSDTSRDIKLYPNETTLGDWSENFCRTQIAPFKILIVSLQFRGRKYLPEEDESSLLMSSASSESVSRAKRASRRDDDIA